MSTIPRLNRLYRLQFEPAQQCHVLLYPEGMVKLNGSAAEILLMVDGVRDIAAIIAALREKFPDAPEDMGEDVMAFLQDAEQKNWVQYD